MSESKVNADIRFTSEAYIWWHRNYRHQEADNSIAVTSPVWPEGGWLKMAREALFLSIEPVAERLKISRSAYSKLEKSAAKKTISIRSLEAAAAAMDCELVISLRPKSGLNFSQTVWKQLVPSVTRKTGVSPRAFAADARDLMQVPKFRRKQGWTKRLRSSGQGSP